MTYPCQCVLMGYRCNAPMTAEDLRCDLCRTGCNAVRGTMRPADEQSHMRIDSITFGGATLAIA